MRIRNKTFAGGHRFLGFAGQPRPRVLPPRIPERVAVILAAPGLDELPLRVEDGDAVAAGQILARDDTAVCTPVLSPVSGLVETSASIPTTRGPAKALLIRADGSRECKAVRGAAQQWWDLDPRELEELLYRSGAAALSPQGIPTRFASSVLAPQDVRHLVVLEAHDEVFNPDLSAILGEREPEGVPDRSGRAPRGSAEAAQGLAILARIMPQARLHLVFGRPLKDAMCCLGRACEAAAEGSLGSAAGEIPAQGRLGTVDLVAVSPKYPAHHEAVLLPAVLDTALPYGSSAAEQGVVTLDLQGLLQVFDAVTRGLPVVERIVALGGAGFARPLHVRTRLGTPVGELVSEYLDRAVEERLVLNSALNGAALSDPAIPVDLSFRTILALPEEREEPLLPFARPGFRSDSYSRTFAALAVPFAKSADTNLHGEHRPCIACGYCEEVCPVRILPYLLHRYIHRDIIDENLVRFEIFKCIDCGLCSYVCTSKIPLATQIKEGKDRLKAEGLEPASLDAKAGPRSGRADARSGARS